MGGPTDDTPLEYGMKMPVDWISGQKTGLFIDQRENRALLERYSKGRSVLNMFCYTGGFSLAALRGGAKLVHSVDSSARAIAVNPAGPEPMIRHFTLSILCFVFISNQQSRHPCSC